MPRVLRAYIPTCNSVFNHATQVPLPTSGEVAGMMLNVPSSLPHRKIWAWGWSVSATWQMRLDLVAKLRGNIIYQQVLMDWSTAAVNNKWYSGIGQVFSQIGAVNEQLFTSIGGTLFAVAPWRLNLTCDQVGLIVESASGGAALFDFGVHVISQQGI